MVVQGDQTVDIFALNHPDSGLFSGGDMVLRSANQVGGDAHYWSGGNFRIEQLNGSLGSLYSPYDPVIRSLGDVSFSNYSGTSLHILAAGSVNVGDILIEAPELGTDSTGFIREIIQLSDGSSLSIDGSNRTTVDIRAGVNPSQISISNVTGADTEIFFPELPSLTNVPTSSDITVANIEIENPNGLVFLTNQYIPNPSLLDGDITITAPDLFDAGIDVRVLRRDGGDGGSVILDSRNNIILNGGIFTVSTSGSGGDVMLLARENVFVGRSGVGVAPSIITSINSTGNAGDVTIRAGGSVALSDNTRILSNLLPLAVGQGGNIDIRARSFSMSNVAQLDASTSGNGDAGRIVINVDDTVTLASGSVISNNVEEVGTGDSGGIEINARSVVLSDNALIDASTFGNGNAGRIAINVDGAATLESGSFIFNNIEEGASGESGGIEIRARSLALSDGAQIIVANVGGSGSLGDIFIDTTDFVSLTGVVDLQTPRASTAIGNRLQLRSVGAGGNIIIKTGSLSLSGGQISASTFGEGNAGNIIIDARDAVSLAYNSGLFSTVGFGAVGNGGEIQVDATSLSINQSFIQTIVRGASNRVPAGRGNSGNITVNLRGDLEILADEPSVFVGILTSIAEGVTETATVSDIPTAGNIRISARDFSISGNGANVASTLDLDSIGEAGNIDMKVQSLTISDEAEITTGTSGQGNAGNITIEVADAALLTNSVISSGVSDGGNGNGGTITFESGSLSVTDGAQFLTSVGRLVARLTGEELEIPPLPPAQGNAGNINISVRGAAIFDGVGGSRFEDSAVSSGIRSEVSSALGGTGGDITIQSGSLQISNSASFSSQTNGLGQAGNIAIDTEQLTLLNDVEVTSITSSSGNAGNIAIEARSLSLNSNADITASTNGQGRAGNIIVQDAQTIFVDDSSSISTEVRRNGQDRGGNITLQTESLELNNQSRLTSSTSGQGDTGEILVQAAEYIRLGDRSQIISEVQPGAIGDSQQIVLQTPTLSLADGSIISTATSGTGSAGTIAIQNAGDIRIQNAERVSLSNSSISTQVQNNAVVPNTERDRQGNITIEARSLNLNNGAQITAGTNGQGRAGNVTVRDAQAIALDDNSAISTEVRRNGTGRGGNITLQTELLTLDDNARINAQTRGRGRAGDITVNAAVLQAVNGGQLITSTASNFSAGTITLRDLDNVTLNGRNSNNGRSSGIFANTARRGQGGTIDIQTTYLSITDGAAISSASRGTINRAGNAGNIRIAADETLDAENGSITTSAARAAGGSIEITGGDVNLSAGSNIRTDVGNGAEDGGNITVTADDVRLRGDSDIRTSVAGGSGDGGDISITAASVIAFDDSDIISEAPNQGGDITLATPVFFGAGYQPETGNINDNPDGNGRVDLDASGQVSSGSITTPNTDFIENSLSNLPENVIDADSLIANSCIARTEEGSSFLVTGSGGLPPRPGVAPLSLYPVGTVRSEPDEEEPSPSSWQPGDPIVEPQGVYRLPDGRLVMSRECP
jgi:large exoprotein involved in heme utilization and adhesion